MARRLFPRDHDASEPLRLTRRDASSIYGTMHDTQRMLARDPDTSSGHVGRAISAGESFLAAVAVGAVAARFGTANIPGTPIPAAPVVGILGHLAGVFHREVGIPEKAVPHIQSVSTGLIDGWGAIWGLGLGAGLRERAGLAPTDVRVGALPGMTSTSIGCGPGCGGNAQSASMQGAPMQLSASVRRPLTEAEQAALYRRGA